MFISLINFALKLEFDINWSNLKLKILRIVFLNSQNHIIAWYARSIGPHRWANKRFCSVLFGRKKNSNMKLSRADKWIKRVKKRWRRKRDKIETTNFYHIVSISFFFLEIAPLLFDANRRPPFFLSLIRFPFVCASVWVCDLWVRRLIFLSAIFHYALSHSPLRPTALWKTKPNINSIRKSTKHFNSISTHTRLWSGLENSILESQLQTTAVEMKMQNNVHTSDTLCHIQTSSHSNTDT